MAIEPRRGTGVSPVAVEGNGHRGLRRRSRRLGHRRREDAQAHPDVLTDAERARIAADIHDLIMQDMAFALANARAVPHDPALASDCVRAAVAACERALDGAREVLAGLASRGHQPVIASVEAAVRSAARDARVEFEARVPRDLQPDRQTTDVLMHIGREAVTNAVKHADAMVVAVSLAYADGWRLLVSDEGCGFDPNAGSGGFGLGSMRRRASDLGGTLEVISAAGRGTVVESYLP